MKKSISIAVCFALLSSCATKKINNNNSCRDAICTAIFAAVTVDVVDNNNNPVTLDGYYAVNMTKGDTIKIDKGSWADGTYVILDDSYTSKMYNQTYDFRFVGYKSGIQIVNEVYSISADCCHVNKKSGKAKITLN